jgi:WD40 repeat protein
MDGSLRYNAMTSNEVSYMSPDGSRIARIVGGESKTMQVFDIDTSSVIYEEELADDAHPHLVFPPDGVYMAGYAKKYNAKIWTLDHRNTVWKDLDGLPDGCCEMAFTQDGSELVARDHQGNLGAWAVDTGKLVARSRCPYIAHRYDLDSVKHFARWRSNRNDPSYARSGLIEMDFDGWVRTLDLGRALWIPFDYKEAMWTGGQTIVLRKHGRLVVIRMGED